MPDSEITQILQETAPYLTGGLGGAILTLITKQWSERASRRIVRTTINKQLFSLPKNLSQDAINADDLAVAYKI